HAGALVVFLVVRQLRGAQVACIAELRRLPDRDDTFTGRNEVDFLVEDPILLADGDRYQEDAVDVVVVALQPWPRLVIVARGLEQLFERRRVNLRRQPLPQLLFARVEEIDPLRHATSVAVASAGAWG